MQDVIAFIKVKDPKSLSIFPYLQCSGTDARLLQKLVRAYVSGVEDMPVLELLQEQYGREPENYLGHLKNIQRLLSLGWVIPAGFEAQEEEKLSGLELLGSNISPSPALLQILEKGISKPEKSEKKEPYKDYMEYLQDQFERIELLQRITLAGNGINKYRGGSERLKNRLSKLDKEIDIRLKATTSPIELEKFFNEKKLNKTEQTIFIALLKEEYRGGEGPLRDMNNLIDLVSSSDYEKIKNRALLEDGSPLLEEGIIDYEETINLFGGISRSFFLNGEIMQRIIHPKERKGRAQKTRFQKLLEDNEFFDYKVPKQTLEDIVLSEKTGDVLRSVLKQLDPKVVKKLRKWGIKEKGKGIDTRMILHGPPGTGKTATALALGGSLNRPVLSLDCSRILSMYVGESEKNVRKIFESFSEIKHESGTDPILLLNEADQFLSSRTQGPGGSAEKMHNQMQNIFLEQIENFEGILIATTNLLENIDPAFSRRFNLKIAFEKPDFNMRLKLWKKMLPKKAEYEEEFNITKLAKYELSGGQIELIIKNTAYQVAMRPDSRFKTDDFELEINRESAASFDGTRNMGFKI